MEVFKELIAFLLERKKMWLIPVVIVLFLFSVLLVFGGGSAMAPFIYSFF